VLLLENGGNPLPLQNVPIYFQPLLHIPEIDYGYYTVPQKHACFAMKEHRSYWPRGMGLGGSSNLNAMIWQRSSPLDYDRWANLSGSDEWKFDNVLKNFKNIEDYHGQYCNEKWHSQDGQGIYVSTTGYDTLVQEFLEAGREMGYPTKDVNGNQEPSFSRLDVSIKEGRRFSAYPGFLEPILSRSNLHIYRFAHVNKIHLGKISKRAFGLTYKRHGIERFVRTKREIIISAGAIDSPKLLMLSGIGPKKHLESLGIKCQINLPVGKNLMDHTMTIFGPFTVDTPGKTNVPGRDTTLNTVAQYVLKGKGIMASATGANAVAYIHSKFSKERGELLKKSPDIQLLLNPVNSNLPETLEEVMSVQPGLLKRYFKGLERKDSFMIYVMLGKPRSRGDIKLASTRPFDSPIMNPKYFSHPDDIKRMVDGINFTVQMVENTKAFQSIGARLINRHFPGCEKYELKTNLYYKCYAKHMTFTVYHQCGTCKMGFGPEDPKAVVDSKLRVLFTKGLRIVDASIIPEVPNGNINAAVMMIADKASEFILDYWAQIDNSMRSRPK
ncbi:Glucose dehydrogenase [FAD, quinone], partial [Orchesella cincta]